jgi:group I intron endonuclease
MKKAWLYITTNLINGKKYIGQTITPKEKGYVGSGISILYAIKKYGKHNFIREDVFYDEWEAIDLLEAMYIEKFDAVKSPLFYNLKDGGHHGKHNNPETSKKMSMAKIGKKDSVETRQHKSDAQRGIKNHFFSKSHSEESINKIKEKRALQIITEESNQKRSDTVKALPRYECFNCKGLFQKKNLIQHHNQKCKRETA